jgi:hypothetical protein
MSQPDPTANGLRSWLLTRAGFTPIPVGESSIYRHLRFNSSQSPRCSRGPRCASTEGEIRRRRQNQRFFAVLGRKRFVNGRTYFRCCHALSLFGTAPRARVRPKHLSPIDPVRHQHQTFIATECISFPILGSRCRDAFLFLFQAIDAGHLVYITVLFPQH